MAAGDAQVPDGGGQAQPDDESYELPDEFRPFFSDEPHRHVAVVQAGSNVCVCGCLVDDDSAHLPTPPAARQVDP